MNHYPIILTLLVSAATLLTSSCNNKRADLAIGISKWLGRELIIPNDLTFTSNGHILDIDNNDYDFYIINYVDSGFCTECALKLPLWEHYMSRLDTSEVKVALLTIIGGEQSKQISRLSNNTTFNYPVSIDTEKKLKLFNGDDFTNYFTTMLLDSEKRIIAVGNPLLYPAVDKLYMKRIFGDIPISNNCSPLFIDYPSKNVGFIFPGDTIYTSFHITNRTDSTIIIQDILKSCNCVSVLSLNKVIYPQSSIRVEVALTYDPELEGNKTPEFFRREVQIIYNENPNPLTININGYYKSSKIL